MTKRKIIINHSIIFLVLSLILFFSAGSILNKTVPEIENVRLWMDLVIYGTILILILTSVSCLVFLKKHKIIGLFIILINLFWFWLSIYLLYRYHITDYYPTFRIADWILILHNVLALVGIIIGYKIITSKLNLKKAVLIDFILIILGVISYQL
ncbi:hypothetical protein SAMN04488007_1434 [Maribacter aquivivus]|uniref:Uncharacterized protein n=1 Tax=Maribacter aquivivus TaxID=228958 RepID=A0A1M6M5R1_9FLAO|nr:hypothetical protein SAMN04488007_1434 [Maribacter aquivivus]